MCRFRQTGSWGKVAKRKQTTLGQEESGATDISLHPLEQWQPDRSIGSSRTGSVSRYSQCVFLQLQQTCLQGFKTLEVYLDSTPQVKVETSHASYNPNRHMSERSHCIFPIRMQLQDVSTHSYTAYVASKPVGRHILTWDLWLEDPKIPWHFILSPPPK